MTTAPPVGSTLRSGRSLALPSLVGVVAISLSFFVFATLRDAVENVARLRFERKASDAKSVIESRIRSYADVLYGLKALFATQAHVTRLEFHRFVGALDLKNRYPGFDVVNFAAYVPARELTRFIESVRRDTSLVPGGYPSFSIKPPGERSEYFVLAYLEPQVGYEFAFGRDLGANPEVPNPQALAEALRKARDTGKLTASGLPIRIRADKDYVGLAMRMPVYRLGMPLDSVEQRRAAYLGSVGAGFNIGALMKAVLGEDVLQHMQVRLYDAGVASDSEEPGRPRRLLFDSGYVPGEEGAKRESEQPPRAFNRTLAMEVGGRQWLVDFSAHKSAVIDRVDTLLPWTVLSGGILSSLLLCGVLYSLASSRTRALGIAQEMTRDLRLSEASLAQAQRMAHLGNWSYQPASGSMTWSAETYRIFDLEPAPHPVPFTDFLHRVHDEDRPRVQEALSPSSCGSHRDIEHRIVTADGAARWVHTIIEGAGAGAERLRGTMMDITARKLAEQELVESRALLNDAQKLSHVGCCQFDPSEGRLVWSEELYRIHGLEPDAFVPTRESTMALVHPEDRCAWAEALAQALKCDVPFASEFRIVRPDGTVRHLRSLGEVIRDSAGRTTSMLWSVLDITEQKRTEDALRASAEQLTALSRRLVDVQEAERRQLSRELHDRVGQNLTALSINLDILRTALDDDAHRARLSDSAALLESTVDSIEDVMAELRPPMLDDYGLYPALNWYARDFSQRTGIGVEVLGSEGAERPAPEIEITLFRIAQEALTNVAKHAGATRVQIELDHATDRCILTVTDNGIGIERVRLDSRERRGFGMVTMRERTQAVGGRFHVRNVRSGGTQIAIEVPAHDDTHTHRG